MIFTHIRSRFVEAFFPRLSEWSAAIILFALGWVLVTNADLMVVDTVKGTGRGYKLLLAIAEQKTWALVLMSFGAVRLTVLFINGAWRRSPILRSLFAFFACFFWTQIALSFAPTFGFAFTAYCGLLGMEMVNIFRAARDARIVDEAYAQRSRVNAD